MNISVPSDGGKPKVESLRPYFSDPNNLSGGNDDPNYKVCFDPIHHIKDTASHEANSGKSTPPPTPVTKKAPGVAIVTQRAPNLSDIVLLRENSL